MTHPLHHIFDRLFRTDDGSVVIAQAPNPPIIGFFVCELVALLVSHGAVHHGLRMLGSAFLFLWAYEELLSGVNLFRRLLGAVVLAATVFSFFHGL